MISSMIHHDHMMIFLRSRRPAAAGALPLLTRDSECAGGPRQLTVNGTRLSPDLLGRRDIIVAGRRRG